MKYPINSPNVITFVLFLCLEQLKKIQYFLTVSNFQLLS